MMHLTYRLLFLSLFCLFFNQSFYAQSQAADSENSWQKPDEDILKILHAPQLPRTSISPAKTHIVLSDPIIYPSLSELGGPMLKLAGTRVNPKNNYYHGSHGGTNPGILTIKDGKTIKLDLPKESELMSTYWTVKGDRFAMAVGFEDRIELWMGDISGKVEKVPNMVLNPLNDQAVRWFPDQQKLLVRRINDRMKLLEKPSIPRRPKS
ncbi:MAG: hypothetical protein R2879_19420 [Saprospiraceae bacterium]